MNPKTTSEILFESFCTDNEVMWEKIQEIATPTPDYIVSISDQTLYFEIKQIDKDDSFQGLDGRSTRIVGDHIRRRITDSKKQIKVGAKNGYPSVLLIYNNLDPMQSFGTEQHDFITAMYGERTVVLQDKKIVDSYLGRNSSLRQDSNTYFSAVGLLRSTATGPTIQLYENVFASNSLRGLLLPSCFEVTYVEF